MVEYTNKSGNISENIRTFALPFEDSVYNFRMMFEYDAWNREQRIVYPDGETVSYDYDRGGQLFKMSNYLDSVLYDKYGAVTSRKYGNGLKMQYAYHPQNRRLTDITTLSGNSQLSHTAYTYDLVGNVTQAVSSYPWLAGQTFAENFAYDSTNQLVSAANPQTYALSVTYGDWGKIQEYGLQQTDLASNTTTGQTRTYGYGSLNEGQTAFAPNNINYTDGTNVNEQYGIGGSLLKRETNRPGNQPETEHYRFTANGNLQAYMYENLLYVHYGYNDANTRTYKYTFDLNPQWVNGRLEAVNFNPRTAMFYPNAYINFNNNGHYTKHYYNGMERIASRLGDRNISINVNDPELQDRKDWQDSLIRKNIVDITGYDFLPVGEEQNHEDPKPIYELPQVGITGLQPIGSGDVFYYHTNHLGSTAYVTDENQSVVQGFLYAPFGEITNEYNNSFGNGVIPKYSFNAKELDEETGMYYYEARYYAPPVFISRDPLFEKYPSISPYAYCANNPVNVIDPTGKEAWKPDEDGNLIAEKGDNAWTLARYLNTSTEIAKKMLAEQGYTVNDKGVLNLKEGDVFKVDYGNKTKFSDNLGLIGNSIRDFASKGIAQDVFSYFWQGKGDVKLTGSQFAGILLFIKNNENAVTDKGKVSLRGRSGKIYIGHRKEINFYGTNNYSLAFGRATVYTNSSGNIVGFYDVYDFNPQKLGARSIKNEIKTRLVNSASNLFGINSSIHINYGYSKWNP